MADCAQVLVGSAYKIRATLLDADGRACPPDTVTATMLRPDDAVVALTPVATSDPWVWEASTTILNLAGRYWARFDSVGGTNVDGEACDASAEITWEVVTGRVPVG